MISSWSRQFRQRSSAASHLIDTAPAYGFGRSEEIVGRALAEGRLRSRVVIATKVGLEWKDGKVFRNAGRDRILREVTDLLRRLRTDYIDIYQVHWPDPLVPLEETAEAMQRLLAQGKIRAIGVSNFSVAEIERFRRVAQLHIVQPPYNLFEREIEAELLPYCRETNFATLTYGALCRGLLSGKLLQDAHFAGRRSAVDRPEISTAALCPISCCGATPRSIRQSALWQARHSPGRALAPRSGCHGGIVGGASPPAIAANRRGLRVVARHCCKGRDRPHSERGDRRSSGPGIHGAAATT